MSLSFNFRALAENEKKKTRFLTAEFAEFAEEFDRRGRLRPVIETLRELRG